MFGNSTYISALLNANFPTWRIVLFNGIGVVAIFLQFMMFQMKRRKDIIFVSMGSNVGWFSYFALQGDLISGVANVIGIMSNIIFLFRENHRWANSKLWLLLFLAVATVFSIYTYQTWKDIFALCGALFSMIAFFMIKEKNIRIISFFTYISFMCNNVSKVYVVALIADITALASLVIALKRYKKAEQKENAETVSNQ